jgi:hypothetical protein
LCARDLTNNLAQELLEYQLTRYPSVTVGDTLCVGGDERFDVLSVEPGRSVALIDTDVEVDFTIARDDVPTSVRAPTQASNDDDDDDDGDDNGNGRARVADADKQALPTVDKLRVSNGPGATTGVATEGRLTGCVRSRADV